jgi:hypothetical protein
MKFPDVPGKTPYERFINLARMLITKPRISPEEGKKRKKRRKEK